MTAIRFLTIEPGFTAKLAPLGGAPDQVHVFDEASIDAVNAALGAQRPLLIRGEPGVGKSQLARAVAKCLGRAFLHHVVDSRTEARDLLWYFDAVARLAEAQIAGVLKEVTPEQIHDRLAPAKFIHPAALWWAFDWFNAEAQAKEVADLPPPQPDGGDKSEGTVLLIDEIDKAESDVPNGLLEALGSGQFTPQGRTTPVRAQGIPPLVIITTNEERALPDAFVRRCMVLALSLPKEREGLTKYLVDCGGAHFPQADAAVLTKAAGQLADDRRSAQDQRLTPCPGLAEYLDLVRAVLAKAPNNTQEQTALLDRLGRYALQKHAGTS